MEYKNFIQQLQKQSLDFRNKKRNEILNKSNPTETEKEVLEYWDKNFKD